MSTPEHFKKHLFSIDDHSFVNYALELFHYQRENNPVYYSFCQALGIGSGSVSKITEIPFLPIEFFKYHPVKTGNWPPQEIFLSSGTTGMIRSQHYCRDTEFYHQVARYIFETRFGELKNLEIVALLPSYMEHGHSSLISMIESFMRWSQPHSSFYDVHSETLIDRLRKAGKNVLLFGVTYALLDLAERFQDPISGLVMETGGMKGRREEITREEVHQILRQAWENEKIYSEYGMTELTSQMYAENTTFRPPSWVKVLVRDINDPFEYLPGGQTGGVNIIDLANINTCAFIETKDLGKLNENGTFEILGRYDNSDIRGCNLMV